jgi:hypothetical protein
MHEDNGGGLLAALTGGGILTFALAPLTLPIIGLTIAFTLPLLAIGVVASIPVAVVAGIWFGMRALVRALPKPRAKQKREQGPSAVRKPAREQILQP